MARNYTPDEIWNLIVRYRWLILIPVAIGIATIPILGRFAPAKYRSDALILVVPQQVAENYVKPTSVETVEDRLPGITAQILSRSRLERIILEMDLYKAERARDVMENVVQRMRTRDIRTTAAGRDINSFSISYVSDNPETARRVTERLASLYKDQNSTDRANQAASTTDLLETQIENTRQRLTEHEKKLAEYRRQHAGQLPSQEQSNLQAQQNASMLLRDVSEAINRTEERRLFYEQQLADLKAMPVFVPTPSASEARATTTDQQLDAARAILSVQLKAKTPDHPDIAKLERNIAELTARLENETPLSATTAAVERPLTPEEAARQSKIHEYETQLLVIERQLASGRAEQTRLRKVIGDYEIKVAAAPTRESELIQLTRDYDALNETYVALLLKKESAAIAANMERRQIGEQFQILDAASLPERPYNDVQRWAVLASGAVSGLLLGVLVLGLREYRDSSFRSKEEIVKALSLPVLASIPVMTSPRERKAAVRKRWAMDVGGSVALVASVAVVVVWRLYS